MAPFVLLILQGLVVDNLKYVCVIQPLRRICSFNGLEPHRIVANQDDVETVNYANIVSGLKKFISIKISQCLDPFCFLVDSKQIVLIIYLLENF